MSATRSFPTEVPQQDNEAPGRVLIVDDDPSVRRLVAKILTGYGHAADVADGTDYALALLAIGGYDVVLVDLDMPGRNGLDLLGAMAGGDPSATPVPILLTGTTDIEAAVAGMKLGAFDYLSKPADPDALRWTVARAIETARARRRERALERAAAEWASTFDACPDVLLVLGPDGRVLRANEAVARLTGLDPAALVGRAAGDLFPSQLGAALAASPGAVSEPRKVFDPVLNRYFLVTVSPIRSASGPSPAVVAVARDETVAVRGEEVRARLYRQLLTAQEDERGRLARELHDGIGQALVSLAVGLTGVADAPIGADVRSRVLRLGQVAAETLEEIRRMAQGLRPTVLDDLGLAAALGRLTEVFTRVHGIRAELLVPHAPIERLRTEVESTIYRITQEALANVAKHARATTVDVVLEVGDRFVRLMVTDDGAGFVTPPRPPARAGLGLSGMKERARMLGGACRVESEPGRGTTLDVQIPISEGEP